MRFQDYRRWALFLLGWTGLSLVFVPEVYLYFLYRSEAIPWTHTLALALANAGIAFVFLPPIVWLTRKAPLEHGRFRSALAVHVPASLAFALGHSGLYALLCYASPSLFHALFVRFHPNLLTYWAIVGFTQAIDYFDRYKDREHRLAQAELLLTKAQLQPHFLFNTLHAVSAMMHDDVRAAEQMIARLSDLLRTVFEHVGAHEMPLGTDLDFVRNYVEIQRLRYGGGVALDIDAPSELMDALVPNMLLQPLVENAIRHGTWPDRNRWLTIGITIAREAGRLRIVVADDGRGPGPEPVREGIGLTATRSRLRELYGDRGAVTCRRSSPSGFRVDILVPYRRATEVAEPWLDSHDDSYRDRGRRTVGETAFAHAARGRA